LLNYGKGEGKAKKKIIIKTEINKTQTRT